MKIYENLLGEVRKRVYGQVAARGDLTFSLCVACRVKFTISESLDVVVYCERERDSEVACYLSIMQR